jgi:hypothetical protein
MSFVIHGNALGRRRRAGGAMLLLLCGLALQGWCNRAAAQNSPPATREARWQEDLNYFATQFPERQKDFSKLYAKDKFDADLAAIRQSIPEVSDSEIIFALSKLVASAHSEHTVVWLPPTVLYNRLPLTLYWYSDGLGVSSSTEEYRQLLGARVVRIGTMTPEQIESAAAPYIPYENEYNLHLESTNWMVETEFLKHLRLTGPDGRVEISVIKPDGEPLTLQVRGLGPVQLRDAHFMTAEEGLGHPLPTIDKAHSTYYWYEYLPETKALYIQYNVCENDPKLPFGKFMGQVFAFADQHSIERTIVDIRFNPGGSSFTIAPLRSGLESRPALIAKGHLYVLIGRGTQSVALDATVDFRNRFHAILVGEPIGEKPNSYGERKLFTLPNSHVQIAYSTRSYNFVKGSVQDSVFPDIPVKRSIADAVAGDPALEMALHHPLK